MEESKVQQERKPSHRLIYFFQGIAFTICILTLILAIYLIVIYHVRLAPYTSYAIVFDAGSSHTEMFVYHWPSDKSNGLGTTSTVDELFVCPIEAINTTNLLKPNEEIKLKSISDFENHVDLLDEYFRPCLTKAIENIPEHRQKISPIFLGATAGMRLLEMKNATRSKQILEKIREIFSHSPFQFVVARQVRILTGMEEAIDGWITTNILLEKFKHRHTQRIQPADGFDPYMAGVLDLGGASTQVTFTYEKTEDSEPVPDAYTTNITLFENSYSPYAHSYLCWGKGEASKRHRARLINSALNSNINRTQSVKSRILVRDPCLPRGTNDTTSISNVFLSPCTANEKQKLRNYDDLNTVMFVGSGNAGQCREKLTQLFDAKRNDLSVNCSYKEDYCTFDHTFQPKIPSNITFIGLSGYYYVFNSLAFRMDNPLRMSTEKYKLKDFTTDEILLRIKNICETNYATLYNQEAMKPKTEQFKRNLCFDSWYIWTLLTHGIGFKESDLKRIIFANKFSTGKVGWTLGYMINQTNYIPAEYREKPLSRNHFTLWLTISIILLSLAVLFLISTIYIFCRTKSPTIGKTKNNYLQPSDQEYA